MYALISLDSHAYSTSDRCIRIQNIGGSGLEQNFDLVPKAKCKMPVTLLLWKLSNYSVGKYLDCNCLVCVILQGES